MHKTVAPGPPILRLTFETLRLTFETLRLTLETSEAPSFIGCLSCCRTYPLRNKRGVKKVTRLYSGNLFRVFTIVSTSPAGHRFTTLPTIYCRSDTVTELTFSPFAFVPVVVPVRVLPSWEITPLLVRVWPLSSFTTEVQ